MAAERLDAALPAVDYDLPVTHAKPDPGRDLSKAVEKRIPVNAFVL